MCGGGGGRKVVRTLCCTEIVALDCQIFRGRINVVLVKQIFRLGENGDTFIVGSRGASQLGGTF